MEFREIAVEPDFGKIWLVLKRRYLPALVVFSGVLATSLAFGIAQKPVYEAQSQLLFRSNRTSQLTGLAEGLGQLETLSALNNPLDTQAAILKSLPFLEETVRRLGLKGELGTPLSPSVLAQNLTVKGIPGTDIMRVTYTSEKPEEAAKIVNTLAEIYLENNLLTNQREAALAREFIAEQLPKVEATALEADAELRRFKEGNSIVSLQQESQAVVNSLSGLNNQITQVEAQVFELEARRQNLLNQIGMDLDSAMTLVNLSQSTGIQSALGELQTAQAELVKQQAFYFDNHPTVQLLQARVSELEVLLASRVEATLNRQLDVVPEQLQLSSLQVALVAELASVESTQLGLLNQLDILADERSQYQSRSSTLPRLEQTERELQRKLQAAQTTYEALLTRLQEVEIIENQNIGNARIISPAQTPKISSGPSSKLFLAGGLFAGGLLGVATAFVIDIFDRSLKTVKDVRGILDYTLLAIIPQQPALPEKRTLKPSPTSAPLSLVPARDYPRSQIGQTYQMLQANLKFLSSEEIRSVVITSSVVGEGRHTVAANLAAAISQSGERVLLVDADLRTPAQHHLWGLINQTGLSHVLVNQVDLQDCATTVMSPKLDVLSSGVLPPNPVSLLESARMASLIAYAKKHYDFIVIVAPALAGAVDAAVLGKLLDGVLLVSQPGIVDLASARSAKEFLKQTDQNVLGLVAHGVNVKNEPDSYFYYSDSQEEYAAVPALKGLKGIPT
ncbi:MAG: polysaccharide biosynthesis tyrosine autokinase [Cyanobacteria bacterium P01_A01_bin.105]